MSFTKKVATFEQYLLEKVYEYRVLRGLKLFHSASKVTVIKVDTGNLASFSYVYVVHSDYFVLG